MDYIGRAALDFKHLPPEANYRRRYLNLGSSGFEKFLLTCLKNKPYKGTMDERKTVFGYRGIEYDDLNKVIVGDLSEYDIVGKITCTKITIIDK
jgi:hypothetical protein